jgi:hypothetical protein
LYQTEDGQTRIQCRLEEETLWLSQAQMAGLFQTSPQNTLIVGFSYVHEYDIVTVVTIFGAVFFDNV